MKDDNHELDAFVINMINNGISKGGVVRFGSVFGFVNDALRINENTLNSGDSICGMICFMIKDAVNRDIQVVEGHISGDLDKDEIIGLISKETDRQSYDAVVTIAEVWSAPIRHDLQESIRPSQSPDRREAVMTMVHLNINFQPHIFTIIQEITRNSGGAMLSLPQCYISSGGEIRGRLTGFENQLCPIT